MKRVYNLDTLDDKENLSMNEKRFSILQVVGITALGMILSTVLLAGVAFAGYRFGLANGMAQVQINPGNPSVQQQQPNLPNRTRGNQPYLGVQFEAVTSELAKTEKLSVEAGAIIRDVVANSPAEKAGFKVGDVISKVNDLALDQNHSLADLVANAKVGDVVSFTVVRGSDTITIKATLGSQVAPQRTPRQAPPGLNG